MCQNKPGPILAVIAEDGKYIQRILVIGGKESFKVATITMNPSQNDLLLSLSHTSENFLVLCTPDGVIRKEWATTFANLGLEQLYRLPSGYQNPGSVALTDDIHTIMILNRLSSGSKINENAEVYYLNLSMPVRLQTLTYNMSGFRQIADWNFNFINKAQLASIVIGENGDVGESQDILYLGGLFEKAENYNLGVLRIDRLNEGEITWFYGLNYGAIDPENAENILRLDYYSGHLIAITSFNQDTFSKAGFSLIRITLQSDKSVVPSNSGTKRYSFSSSDSDYYRAAGLNVRSTSEIEFFQGVMQNADYSSALGYYCLFSFDTGQLTMVKVMDLHTGSTGILMDGSFMQNGVGVWVGTKSTIYNPNGTQNLSFQVGYVMRYPESYPGNSCINEPGTGGSSSQILNLQSETWSSFSPSIRKKLKNDNGSPRQFAPQILRVFGDTIINHIYQDNFYDDSWCIPKFSASVTTINASTDTLPYTRQVNDLVFVDEASYLACPDSVDPLLVFIKPNYHNLVSINQDAKQITVNNAAGQEYKYYGHQVQVGYLLPNGQLFNAWTTTLILQDGCSTDFEVTVQEDIAYVCGTGAVEFQLLPFTGNICSSGAYFMFNQYTSDGNFRVLYAWFSFSSETRTLTVESDDSTTAGVYNMFYCFDNGPGRQVQYTKYSNYFGYKPYSFKCTSFELTIWRQCNEFVPEPPILEDHTYTTGYSEIQIVHEEFVFDSEPCTLSFDTCYMVSELEDLIYYANERIIKVQGEFIPGDYIISIICPVLQYNKPYGKDVKSEFTLSVLEQPDMGAYEITNSEPYIKNVPKGDIKIIIGTEASISIGEPLDLEDDLFVVQVSLGGAIEFAKWDPSSLQILLSQNTTENELGTYLIQVTIQEQQTQELFRTDYFFNLIVISPNAVQQDGAGGGKQENESSENVEQNMLNEQSQQPEISLDSISKLGEVMLKFTKHMNVIEDTSSVNTTIFEVKIIPAPEQEISKLNFTWECLSMNERFLELQIKFESAAYVSASGEKDHLQVKLINDTFFMDQDDLFVGKKETTKFLPSQMQLGSLEATVTATTEALSSASQTIVIGNLVLSFFASAALNLLWGMVNALQMMVILPLVSVSMPGNISVILMLILNLANFDILPVDNMIAAIFDFTETESYTDQFEEGNIESQNLVVIMGTMFFFMLLMIIQCFTFLLLVLISIVFKSTKIDQLKMKIQRSLFFNGIIRFLLEGSLEILIGCFINLQNMLWETKADYLPSLLSIVLLVMCIILAIMIPIFLNVNYSQLDDHKFAGRFDSLYSNLRKAKKSAVLFYNQIFLIRRFAVAIILVLLANQGTYQIIFMRLLNLFQFCYIVGAMPLEIPFDRKLEMFNELVILLLTFFLALFTGFIPDAQVRYDSAWIAVALTSIAVLVNISIILMISLKDQYFKVKKNRDKKRLLQKHKQKYQQKNLGTTQLVQEMVAQSKFTTVQAMNNLKTKQVSEKLDVIVEEDSKDHNADEQDIQVQSINSIDSQRNEQYNSEQNFLPHQQKIGSNSTTQYQNQMLDQNIKITEISYTPQKSMMLQKQTTSIQTKHFGKISSSLLYSNIRQNLDTDDKLQIVEASNLNELENFQSKQNQQIANLPNQSIKQLGLNTITNFKSFTNQKELNTLQTISDKKLNSKSFKIAKKMTAQKNNEKKELTIEDKIIDTMAKSKQQREKIRIAKAKIHARISQLPAQYI